MNRYRLFQAGIHVQEGLNRFEGDSALYESLLFGFPKDPYYAALCHAIQVQDVEAAFQAAHALKGETGNLSLDALCKALNPLVEELRAHRLEHAAELLQPVSRAYEQTIAALAAEAKQG